MEQKQEALLSFVPDYSPTLLLCLSQLHSPDGAVRKTAREQLVKMGKTAVPYLICLLSHPDSQIRWEACKTLEKIRDPRSVHSLASMLLDDNMDVRWVAADALIELEYHAIEPVLEIIEEHFDSVVLREAAHHVLHSLREAQLLDEESQHVLKALTMYEMPTKAAFAAIKALDHLRSAGTEHLRRNIQPH